MQANIITNKGTIELKLFYEEAPITVSNFVNLSKREYYNNLSFHRVIEDFMIQGGCPLGTGTGVTAGAGAGVTLIIIPEPSAGVAGAKLLEDDDPGIGSTY